MKLYLKTAAVVCSIMMMTNTYAQTLSITYYPEERLESKTHSSYSTSENQLTEDAEFMYERVEQSLVNAQNLVIKKINKSTGKRVWEKTVPVPAYDRKDNSYFCDLEKTSSGFILFKKRENAKAKESYLTGQLFDENLRPFGDEEQITTIGYRDDGNLMPLFYKVVKDGNHFLVYPQYYFVNDFKNKPFKFTMIDDKLAVKYEKEIEFPQNQFYQLHTVKFESNLSMKAVFLVSNNGKKISDAAGSCEYMVVNYNYAQSDLKTETISFGNKFKFFGNDLADFESKPGLVLLSGQYHKTAKNKGYEGIFNIRFNLGSMQTEEIQLIEYSQALKTMMIGNKNAEKGKLPASYSIQNQYVDATSDVIYVLEAVSSATSKGDPDGHSTTFDKTTYSYDNIIILKANAKGDVLWFKPVVRNASDPYKTYTPIYTYQVKDYTILLFNTSASSAKTPDPDLGYSYSIYENVLMAMVFDKNGNTISTESFAPKVSKGMSCNMLNIRNINNNTLELSFDKVSKTYKLESITRARLLFE